MRRYKAAGYRSKLVCRRTVAFRAAALIGALGWLTASHGSETEFALLPAVKSDLVEQSLLLDVERREPTALRGGDVTHSLGPDVSFTRDMGLLLQLRIYAVAPLSSWWRIASACSVFSGVAGRGDR